ncbi:MAG: AAA-like domain-containing protein [Pelatocladus maniniholoensis HA4357-MV3]|jgi:hypothetical protein|uniref:AAA-like domain-containing protein n=1 Tax=Pelatocladus maniniholoensis HA4357-MV3 TaxID=1117104 RepID=A0A9E3LRR1_9NOST|nr:AAA-like domain-containing protein [Pelatocladus maniniholoensis HA4357-MV3]BAZ67093.1 TPR repeat-containing protein [Fischerella sp. NIES-4106]
MKIDLNNYYQWGGCLKVDAPSYVERTADKELLDRLKLGEYCYVLNAIEMGKSSLMIRTKKKLEQEGFACAAISLKSLSQDCSHPDDWYQALFDDLVKNFYFSEKLNSVKWWKQQHTSPLTKLLAFVEKFLLVDVNHTRIVILFDEIDAIFRLNFIVDDFFAFIQYCYQGRAENSAYNYLNFALFGVAQLSLLKTNLNIIARTIDLTAFQLSETKPLAYGLWLAKKAKRTKNVLKEILNWTNGQPYLTQRICDLVVKSKSYIQRGEEVDKVKYLVKTRVIEDWKTKDTCRHLDNILIYLLQNNSTKFRRLSLYQKVLQQEDLETNNLDQISELIELTMAGLIVKTQENLRIGNRIYQYIFDEDFVIKNLADVSLLYREKFSNWLVSQEQDQSQLLYGQELEKVWKWAKYKNLNKQEHDFLLKSQLFDATTKVRLCSIDNYESVVKAVFVWTRGQKKLNDLIFDLAKFNQLPSVGSEVVWVDNLVRSQILDKWPIHVKNHSIAEFHNQLLLVYIGKLKMLAVNDHSDIAEVFREWIPELEKKTSCLYSHLIEVILLWTKPHPVLVETLCQLICEDQSPIPLNHEAEYIQQLVQNQWISQWETQVDTQPIRETRDRLLKNPNCEPFRLLIRYRQILKNEVVLEDIHLEDEELLKIKLVSKINGSLRVANLTYEAIFNLIWVDQSITNISRPYHTQKFIDWLDSRHKEKSQLLVGEELEKTKIWADLNKQLLTEQERDFITWSIIANF